jgi:hypothetical protein
MQSAARVPYDYEITVPYEQRRQGTTASAARPLAVCSAAHGAMVRLSIARASAPTMTERVRASLTAPPHARWQAVDRRSSTARNLLPRFGRHASRQIKPLI